ncbi:MAG: DUF2911 domain-containing protein [Gemmatimonadota bacterium]
MKRVPFVLVLGSLTAAPLVAQRPAGGAFVIRLGSDTTAVERFTRAATRLEGDVVSRAPRTTVRHYVVDFAPNGNVTRAEIVVRLPGAPVTATPLQRILATFTGDSAVVEIRRDTAVQTRRIAVAAGTVPMVGGAASTFASFELLAQRFRAARSDSLPVRAYYLGGASTTMMGVKAIGRDSLWIYDGNDVFHARADNDGLIQGAVPLSGTQQFSIARVATVDIDGLATAFAARERQGQGLGQLSTRDTVRATVAGASLWIDYGRPAKRGRVLFGSTIVPWGEVWRTGANAATQFRTDRDLELGGVRLPAGFYTLWTIPSQSGWKLLINSETGQWGTNHHANRDVFQLDMRVATLPQPVERFTIAVAPDGQGGVLKLQWDATEASIPFTVR